MPATDPRRLTPADDSDHRQLAALLGRGVGELGLALPIGAEAQLIAYLVELRKWNTAYNLTAVRDPRHMVVRHLLDSLAIIKVLDLPADRPLKMIDVGSGAGLPGIAFAIAQPAWRLTVLDSNGKKVRFLRHAQRSLGLANVEVAESRAERFQPTEPFDYVISRAFASLADFVGWTAHLAGPSGVWLAMKGRLDAAEAAALPVAFRIDSELPVQVPGLDEVRHLIMLRRAG
jgi:16S rRNA (guanine527-N7)-methyltransferase